MTIESYSVTSDNTLLTGRDYTSLKNSIANWINKSNLSSIIPDLINITQLRLERKFDFKFMEALSYGSLIEGDYHIDLPALYKKTDFLHLVIDGVVYKLSRKSEDYCMSCYPSLTNDIGSPKLFYINENSRKIVIRPTLDGSYDYKFKYYAFSPVLSDTNLTNWWTASGYDVILFGSLLLAEPYLRNDARLATWRDLYSEAFKDIHDYMIEEDISGSSPETHSMYVTEGKEY